MSRPISEGDLNKIREEIFAGRTISAIKLYRQCTGSGLKEAKDAVEEMERKLRVESPGRFLVEEPKHGDEEKAKSAKSVPGVQAGKGCFGMLAGMVLVLILTFVVLAFRH